MRHDHGAPPAGRADPICCTHERSGVQTAVVIDQRATLKGLTAVPVGRILHSGKCFSVDGSML